MALSPADFYAYSRATGAPVPEDPRERAEMAPEVLEFRRNQLKSPESELVMAGLRGFGSYRNVNPAELEQRRQEFIRQDQSQGLNSIVSTVGTGLAIAGGLAAALGARRLMRAPKQSATAGVRQANLTEMLADEPAIRRAATVTEPQPSKVPSQVVRQKPQGFTPRSYLEEKGALEPSTQVYPDPWDDTPDLTTKQQQTLPQVIEQKIESVESGANQQQLRTTVETQRNEDLDLSSAQRFLQRERDEIASELGEQGIVITPSRVEQELSNRLGKTAYNYGPKYTARKQALELYAQTGSPVLLERLQTFGLAPASFETFETMPVAKQIGFENAPPFSTSYYPSEELFAEGLTSNINVDIPTRGKISIADFRKPVITESTAQQAEKYYQTKKGEALDWLGNLRVQLEPQRNQILKERRLIVEQSAQKLIPQLEAAKQAGQTDLAAKLEENLNNLRTLWQNPRLGTHRADELYYLDQRIAAAQNKIKESIAGIQKKYPTTIADWSGESARIFGELDTETGELIPESIEIRGDRPSRMLEPKGGGGRNLAEYTAGERLDEEIRTIQGGGRIRDYDPETGAVAQRWLGDNTQTGRAIDAYGIRLSGEKKADPTKRPSEPQYTKQEIADEAMRMSQADPYGDVPVVPEYADVVESLGYQEPTPERKASVLLSEQVRKGLLQFPKQNFGPYSSSPLAVPVRINIPEQQKVNSQQLTFPSDVVPATSVAARVRQTPADVAAEQLESYMSKLQRGRSTPITSAVRIQPSLF